MTSFEKLPFEILDRICTHLQISCYDGRSFPHTPATLKGLLGLCSTSKRLHQVALPYLYRRIRINGSHTRRLTSLTQSLIENPQLGGHVRDLDLEELYDNPDEEPGYLKRDNVLDFYFASLPPTGLQGEVVNSHGSVAGGKYWYTVRVLDLLVTRLRHLMVFSLVISYSFGDDDDGSGDECWRLIMDKHKDDPSFLNRLQEIILHHCDTQGSLAFGSVVNLIRQTNIRKLVMWSCSHESLQGVSVCNLPSLLELRLGNAALGENDLAKFVRWFPNLEYLLLDQPCLATVTETLESPITANQACRAILPLKNTLRTFVLFLGTDYDVEPIVSLESFHKLRHLIIEMSALIEDDSSTYEPFLHKLPESLEYLCLEGVERIPGLNDRRWTKEFKSQQIELLQLEKGRMLPNLRKIVVSAVLRPGSICNERKVEYREFDRTCTFRHEFAAEQEAWSTS